MIEPSTLVLILLGLSMVLFIFEWIRAEFVALLLMVAVVLIPVDSEWNGLLSAREAVGGFGSEAVVSVGGMLVIAAALTRTGAVLRLGDWILRLGASREWALVLALSVVCATLSAFINNTTVVAVFIPVGIRLARASGISPSKILIPISYATILGGTCTLIGTSTNIVVSGLAVDLGLAPLGMWEFTPLGLIYCAVGLLATVFISRPLLPRRDSVTTALPTTSAEYVTELVLAQGCPLVGRTVREALEETHRGVQVLHLGRSEGVVPPPVREVRLAAGDQLVIRAPVEVLLALRGTPGVVLLPDPLSDTARPGREAILAEVVVAPGARCLGATLRDLKLRAAYGVAVLAVERRGGHLAEGIGDLRLEMGDVLLVLGTPAQLADIRTNPDFIVLDAVDARVVRRDRAPHTLAIVSVVVALASVRSDWVAPLCVAASLALVGLGCLTAREAWRSIELPVLALIAGTLALGRAMERSGADKIVADTVLSAFSVFEGTAWHYAAVISGVYLATSLLTEFISNNAAAALLTPIAVSTAAALHVDPRAFLFAVAFAASASFATPVGYQTNTMVYSAGNYRFTDFVKAGSVVNLVCWIVASIAIPLLWPAR